MMGEKIQQYISNNSRTNKRIEELIGDFSRQKSKINDELKGNVQVNTAEAVSNTMKILAAYIDVKNEVIPVLEETIYWEKEYKRREENKSD